MPEPVSEDDEEEDDRIYPVIVESRNIVSTKKKTHKKLITKPHTYTIIPITITIIIS